MAAVNVHFFCTIYGSHHFRIITPSGAATQDTYATYGFYGDKSFSINAGHDTSFTVLDVENNAPMGSTPNSFYQSATNGQFLDGFGRPSSTGVGQVVVGWGKDPSTASSSPPVVLRAHLYNGTSANRSFNLNWGPTKTTDTGMAYNFAVPAGGSLDVVRSVPQGLAPGNWVPGYAQFFMSYSATGFNPYSSNLPVAQGQVTDFGAFGYGVDASVLAAHKPDPKAKAADPVDAATGRFVQDETVLSVQGARPVGLVLHFSSLGFGSDYDASLQGAPTLPRVTWPGQWVNAYAQAGAQPGVYASYDLSALHDALVADPDGSYTLTKPDQSQYVFGPLKAGDGRLLLTSMADPCGRRLLLAYPNQTASSRGSGATVTEPVSGKTLTLSYDAQDRLASAADPLGRQVTFQYNGALTMPSQVQLRDANGTAVKTTSYTYEPAQGPAGGYRLKSITDQDGRTVMSATYDAQDRVVSQDDGRGDNQLTRFAYGTDAQGNATTAVTDRTGQVTTYHFNAQLQLVEKDDPLGHAETWQVDASGNVLSHTNPNGHTTVYTYDANGNALSVTDAASGVTKLSYDGLNRLTSRTDASGQTTAYAYDTRNNLTSVTDPLGNVTRQGWDANSLLQSRTLPRGGVESFSYANGLPVSKRDAEGNAWAFGYDAAGRLTSQQDPTGATTLYGYDGLDRLTSLTDPLGHTRSWAYNARGWLLSQTDALGNTTAYGYDGNGNRVSRTDPAPGGAWAYAYDGEDRLTLVTDPLGHSTAVGRDAAGRVTSLTDGLGNTRAFQLDGLGQALQTYGAAGQLLRQDHYDADERLDQSTDGANRTTDWYYDARGLVQSVTDGLGHSTAYARDALGRLTGATDPLGARTQQGFDPDGNLTGLTNGLGQTTSLARDPGGRLTAVTTPSGAQTARVYEARGLTQSISRPSGQQVTYAYDAAGNLTQAADGFATTTYTYDADGRLSGVQDNAYGQTATPRQTARAYDGLGRLTQYTDAFGNTFGYGYDQAGNLTQLTYPDGRQVAYAYDANNRLTQVTDWAGRVTAYHYDGDGRLVESDFANGTKELRGYDGAGQLTGLTVTDASGNVLYGGARTLDQAARVTAESVGPALAGVNAPAVTMAFDADNRVSSFNGQAVTYDADGNLTLGPVATTISPTLVGYSYDARNRLSSAGGYSYAYDPEGRRVQVTDPAAGVARYAIDPSGALDRALVQTRTVGGQTTTTYYVYGLGLIGQEEGGVYRQYHFDARGSTVLLTDSNGAVTDNFAYGPYGEAWGRTGYTSTPFQFNGKYGVTTDPNGLLCMRARFYHPILRRFLNQDVLLGAIDPGIGLNRYAFANGNPVSLIDPFGLCAERLRDWTFGYLDGLIQRSQWWMDHVATLGLGALIRSLEPPGSDTPFAYLGFYNPNSAVGRAGIATGNQTVDLALSVGLAQGLGSAFSASPAAVEEVGTVGVATQDAVSGSTKLVDVLAHGLRHIAAEDQAAVVQAIQEDIATQGAPSLGNAIQRTISVNGRQFSYRAFGLPEGKTSVGTVIEGSFRRDITEPR